MPYTDIDGTPGSLVPPFNPDKLTELLTAALIAGGFTIPPIVIPPIDSGNTLLNVSVPEGEYNEQQKAAIVSILDTVAADPTRNQQTQAQIFATYIALNLQYKDVFANASYVLETGIALLATPSVAAYRTILNDTLAALVPLAGTSFETHFNRERAAQGVPQSIPINTMTLAQCATLDNVLHIWLTARKVDALIAQT